MVEKADQLFKYTRGIVLISYLMPLGNITRIIIMHASQPEMMYGLYDKMSKFFIWLQPCVLERRVGGEYK